jgi:hypothetical protein
LITDADGFFKSLNNMKNRFLLNLIILLAITGVFVTGCKDDDSKATKVYGTITFENANVWQTWQDSGEVQVTVFPEFSLDPLAGWGEVPDNFFGPNVLGGTFPVGAPYNSQNPVILTYKAGQTTYDYEIELEPGTYSALAVGFRHNFVNDPNLKTATLGVHWGKETEVSHGIVIRVKLPNGNIIKVHDYPAPSTFTIKAGEQKEINFKANFGFVEQWY